MITPQYAPRNPKALPPEKKDQKVPKSKFLTQNGDKCPVTGDHDHETFKKLSVVEQTRVKGGIGTPRPTFCPTLWGVRFSVPTIRKVGNTFTHGFAG